MGDELVGQLVGEGGPVGNHELAPPHIGVALQVLMVVVAELLLVAVPVGGVVASRVDGVEAFLVGGSLRLQQRVFLYFLFNGQLEVSDGQLQQPHQLYLLR